MSLSLSLSLYIHVLICRLKEEAAEVEEAARQVETRDRQY